MAGFFAPLTANLRLDFTNEEQSNMADIHIVRPHSFPPKEARAKAEEMADHLGQKFGLKGDWKGNELAFTGPGVNGLLKLKADSLELEVSLGFLLKAMKGSLEKAVNGELDKLFAAKESKAKEAKPTGKAVEPAAKAPAKKAVAKAPAAKTVAKKTTKK
jgi:putative polyhydroxyalkanoate system protein